MHRSTLCSAHHTARLAGLGLLLFGACSSDDADGNRGSALDAGRGGSDGGALDDAGNAPRDGAAADGGVATDAALVTDGALATDGRMAGAGPAPVALGAAGTFTVLAKSAISNVPSSVINGDLGLSPAAASYVTGFALTRAGTHWTSAQVVGSVFAADNDPPSPSNLTTAIGAMETAYTDAAGRPDPDQLNLGGGAIGGRTLQPGFYKWTSAVSIPSDLTLSGAADDTWLMQVEGDLTMSVSTRMILSGGAQAKNVVWQVSGVVQLAAQTHAEGVFLGKTAIKLGTGATVDGRLLAQTAVELASNTVTPPAQ